VCENKNVFYETGVVNRPGRERSSILNSNILFVHNKMVVLTIVSEKNGETIYFDDDIPQVHFIKLISCSVYNSWDTLKKEGSAGLGDIDSRDGVSIGKIPPGH